MGTWCHKLAAYEGKNRQACRYRVDKMTDITVTHLPRNGAEQYPPLISLPMGKSTSVCTVAGKTVILRANYDMAGIMLDRVWEPA